MTARLSELQRIQEAMNTTKSTRMQQRYQVILLHLKGYQNIQIADIVGRCEIPSENTLIPIKSTV